VFLLYSDPDSRVDAVLDRVQSTSPDVTVRDEYGADHLLWRMSDSSSIGAIRKEMADKPVVIADGHHRYETALAFRDERRREAGSTTGGSSDWLMATMVNMDSPGMTILPTHRLLTGFDGLNRDALIRSARAYFDVTEVRGRDALERALRENGASRPSIGLAVGESAGLFLFTLRADVEAARVVDGVSAAQSMLDVVILHRLVLEKCLGISEDQVRGETYLRYIRGFGDAIEQVRTGRAQVAFLLNATRLDQVRDIAFSGEVLPQKSTDFFPKLLTGLTMYGMD
jgi:uncharacterized protein (DUF1015 family)